VKKEKNDMMWAAMIHIGRNGWAEKNAADHVRFDENLWRDVSVELKRKGANTVVFSLGEALAYPSHPELAVKGSWSPEKMKEEITRLRSMGFSVVPKLNFSTTHDLWLGEYGRMVSTKKYYEVCSDIIRDVVEIFGTPEFFHLGFDEEVPLYQQTYEMCVLRQGDLWWHDFLWFVKQVESHGVRAWTWSGEKHDPDEFARKMPKSVLQSPWLYMGLDNPKYNKQLITYHQLADRGYDMVPCGSNVYGVYGNFVQNALYCKEKFPKELIKGFVHAPWIEVTEGIGTSLYYEKNYSRRARLLSCASEIGDGAAIWKKLGPQ
jgi:hypothetical protein